MKEFCHFFAFTAFTICYGIIITINIKIYEIAYYLIKIKIRYQVSRGAMKNHEKEKTTIFMVK